MPYIALAKYGAGDSPSSYKTSTRLNNKHNPNDVYLTIAYQATADGAGDRI